MTAPNQLQRRLQRMKDTGMITSGSELKKSAICEETLGLFPAEEKVEETPSGNCFFRETVVPLKKHHGGVLLESSLECTSSVLQLLMNDPPDDFQPYRSLFLDLETTGLACGTGTWAFLMGVGWFENGLLRVRQYFLKSPPEERALLEHFTATLQNFDNLVTFNGKSFDLPLVHTRQVLKGISPVTSPDIHLDLFHCCRRMWKNCLPDCSLVSMEKNLLQFHRSGDIPGEEIPEVYFRYLRRGETQQLKQVFEHNLLDIVSLVALLGLVAKIENIDFLEEATPRECCNLGILHWKYGDISRAEICLQQAMEKGNREEKNKALYSLALLHKQMRRWEKSASCWEGLIHQGYPGPAPYVELAKIYEHRIKNLPQALRLTREALNAELRRYQMGVGGKEINPLKHRLRRLEAKLKSNCPG